MKTIFISFFLNTKKDRAKMKIKKIVDEIVEEGLSNSLLAVANIQSSFDETMSDVTKLNYEITINDKLWSDIIFKLIKFAQSIGIEWICTGSIENQFSFWSNKPKISGVVSIDVELCKTIC